MQKCCRNVNLVNKVNEMNDLRGILLFLMLLGLPFIASVNLECRKHFTCVNTTYFNICVDFGDGKLRTIEGLIFPCPSGFICDETNINECQRPVVTIPTLLSSTPTSLTDKSTSTLNTLKDVSVTIPLVTQTNENPDQTKIILKHGFNKEDSKIIEESTTKDNVALTYLVTEKTFPMKSNITIDTNLENNTISYNTNLIETITENELTVHSKNPNATPKMVTNSSEFDIRLASYSVIPEGNSSAMKNGIDRESLLFNGSKDFNKIANETVNNKISPSSLDTNINISSNNYTSQPNDNTSLPIDISQQSNTDSNNAGEKNANTTKHDIFSLVTKPIIANIEQQSLKQLNMYNTTDIGTKFLDDMLHEERTNQIKNSAVTMVEGKSRNNANHTKIVSSVENFTEKELTFSATEHRAFDTTFKVRTIPTTVQNNVTGVLPTKNNFTQTDTDIYYIYPDIQYNTTTEYAEILRNFTQKILPATKTTTEENEARAVITTKSFTDQTTSTINILDDKKKSRINDTAKMIKNNDTKSTIKVRTTTNEDKTSIKNEQPPFTEATLTYVPYVNTNVTTLILDTNHNASEGINNDSYNNLMVTTNSPIVTTTTKLENITQLVTSPANIPLPTENIAVLNASKIVNLTLINKPNIIEVKTNTLAFEVISTSITVNSYVKPKIVNSLNENRKFAIKNLNITNNDINKGGNTDSTGKISSTQKGMENDFNENVDIFSVTPNSKHNFSNEITNESTNIFDTSTENAIHRVTTPVDQINTTNNMYNAAHVLTQEKSLLSVGQTYENVVPSSYTATPSSSPIYTLMKKKNETFLIGKLQIISTDIPMDVSANMAITPATSLKVSEDSTNKFDNYLMTTINTEIVEQFPSIEATTTLNVVTDVTMKNNNDNSIHGISKHTPKEIFNISSEIGNTVETTTPNAVLPLSIENKLLSNISKSVNWLPRNMSNILQVKTNTFATTTEVIAPSTIVKSFVEPKMAINSLNENTKLAIEKSLNYKNNISKVGKIDGIVKVSSRRQGEENEDRGKLSAIPYTKHNFSNDITNEPTIIFNISAVNDTYRVTTPVGQMNTRNNTYHTVHLLTQKKLQLPVQQIKENLLTSSYTTMPLSSSVNNVMQNENDTSFKDIMNKHIKQLSPEYITSTNIPMDVSTNKSITPAMLLKVRQESINKLGNTINTEVVDQFQTTLKEVTDVSTPATLKGNKESMNKIHNYLFTTTNTAMIEQFPSIEATTIPIAIAGMTINNNNKNSEHGLSNNIPKTMYSFTSSLENTTEMATAHVDLPPSIKNIVVSNVSKPVSWLPINKSNILEFKTNTFAATTEIIATNITVNSHVKSYINENSLKENTKLAVEKSLTITNYNAPKEGKTASTVKINSTRKDAENDLNATVDILSMVPYTERNIGNEVINEPSNIYDSSTEHVIHRVTSLVNQINTTNNAYHATHLMTKEQLQLPVGQRNENLATPSYTPTGHSVNDLMQNENDTTSKGKMNKDKNQSSTEYIISTDIPMDVLTKKAIIPAILLKVSEESTNKLGNYLVTTINTGIVEQLPSIETTTRLNVVADVTMATNKENSEYKLSEDMPETIQNSTPSLIKTTKMTTPNTGSAASTEHIAVSNVSKPVDWPTTNKPYILESTTNIFSTNTEEINSSTIVNSHDEPNMIMSSLNENPKLAVQKSLIITNNSTTITVKPASDVKISSRQKSAKHDVNENMGILPVASYTKHNFSNELTNKPTSIFETSTENITNGVTIPMGQFNATNTFYLLEQVQLPHPVRQTNENLVTPSYTATVLSSSVNNVMQNESTFSSKTNKDNKQLSTEYITSTDIPIYGSTNKPTRPRVLLKVSKESMKKLDNNLVATTNAEVIRQFPSIESTTSQNVIAGITMNNSNGNSENGLSKKISQTVHNVTYALEYTKEVFYADLPLPIKNIAASNVSKPLNMGLTNNSNIVEVKANTHLTATGVNNRVEPKVTMNNLKENTKLTIGKNFNITNISENIPNTANTSTVQTTQMKKIIKPSTNITFSERNFEISNDHKQDTIFRNITVNAVNVHSPVTQNMIPRNIVQGDVFLSEKTIINAEESHVQQKNITKEATIATMVIPPAENKSKIEETQNKLKINLNVRPNFAEINYTTTLETFTTNVPPSMYVGNAESINNNTKYQGTVNMSKLLKPGVITVHQNINSTELSSNDIASIPSLNHKNELLINNNESHIQSKINNTVKSFDNLHPTVLLQWGKNKTTMHVAKSGSQIESSERVVTSKNIHYQDNLSNTHKLVDFNTTSDVRKVTPMKTEMFRIVTGNSSKEVTINNELVIQGKINTTNIIDTSQPLKKAAPNMNSNMSTHTENSRNYIIVENRYNTSRPIMMESMENIAVHLNKKPQAQQAKVNNLNKDIIIATKKLLDVKEIFMNKKIMETSTISTNNTTRKLSLAKLTVDSSNLNNTQIDVIHQNSTVENLTKATTIVNNTASESDKDKILAKIVETTENIPVFQEKTNGTIKRHDLNTSNPLKFDCSQRSPGKYADSDDCRTFYICVAKRYPVVKKCPGDTVFSEIRKQCTKNLAQCIRNNEFQCPSAGRFRDITKDNCYYICVMNKQNKFVKFKFQCQNGFHLNVSSIKCIWDDPKPSSDSESNGSEIGTSSESNMKSKVSSSAQKDSTEDIKCKTEGKFADLNDCRKYYECSEKNNHFRRKIKKCGSDEVFHSEKKSSTPSSSNNMENNGDNGERTEEATKPTQNIRDQKKSLTFDCRHKNRGNYADQNDCKTYYTCIGKYNALVRDCPEYMVFSEMDNKCTKNLSLCIRQNEFKCTSDGKFIDIFKHNYYYICVWNFANNNYLRYHLKCEDGFYLDKSSIKCMQQEKFESSSVSEQQEQRSIASNQDSNKSETQEATIGRDFKCVEEGKFSDPYNNNKYYICSRKHDRFRKKKKKCKRDEVFHKVKKQCVSAEIYE